MKQIIITLAATILLISCSDSNNKPKPKKPGLNKFDKTMCFFRLRNRGCDEWMASSEYSNS